MRTIARILSGSTAAAVALAYGVAAHAGPTDTALPLFSNGASSVHVYTAVGVIKRNSVETVFICTNVDTVPVNIGVEVFEKDGTLGNSIPAGNGESLGVPVGATVTFGTSGTALLTEDVILATLPALDNGSGRIIASTKNIECIALLMDELHGIVDPAFSTSPPPMAVSLPLFPVP